MSNIPKQPVSEVRRSPHGGIGKHPGNSKTRIAYMEKKVKPKSGAIDQGMEHAR